MPFNSIRAVLILAVCAAMARADSEIRPLFEETFNTPNDRIRYVFGAARGGPGSGVSGKSSDLAYVSSPKTTNQDPQSPAGYATSFFVADSLPAFTVSFWYRLDEKSPDIQVPLSISCATFLLGKNGFEVRVVQPSKDLQFVPGRQGPIVDWTTTGRWIFAAFTWEQATNTMTFYQGTLDAKVALMRDMKRPAPAPSPAIPRPNLERAPEVIGNMHARGDRPLSGSLDNIRVFGRAMNGDEIEQIRRADSENMAPVVR